MRVDVRGSDLHFFVIVRVHHVHERDLLMVVFVELPRHVLNLQPLHLTWRQMQLIFGQSERLNIADVRP